MSGKGRRFVNVIIFVLLVVSAWVWFAGHIKPHVEQVLFGAVSLAAIGGVALAVWRIFFSDEETKNAIREFMDRPIAALVLLLAFIPVAIAFAVTATIYVKTAGDPVRLTIKRDTGSLKTVTVDKASDETAVTYFALFHPISLTLTAERPPGFQPKPLTLRRALPLDFTVQDDMTPKIFHIVRLIPGDNFFSLRGRQDPDPFYELTVSIDGKPVLPSQKGLKFQAIYLGAKLDDLEEAAKRYRMKDLAKLQDLIGASTPSADRDRIMGEWLDDPLFIATPELTDHDEVDVKLTMGGVEKHWPIHPKDALTTTVLRGVQR